jgi:hypothetical protein
VEVLKLKVKQDHTDDRDLEKKILEERQKEIDEELEMEVIEELECCQRY